MIELNKKTQQDFLNREWVQKLLDAGVDMSDAKYYIRRLNALYGDEWRVEDAVFYKEELDNPLGYSNCIPTYTVSELLYKLHEYIYPTIRGIEYSGGLKMLKDAPFYIFYYSLTEKGRPDNHFEDYIFAEAEYPIESLASLLIQCHKQDIGLNTKDTGNISDK